MILAAIFVVLCVVVAIGFAQLFESDDCYMCAGTGRQRTQNAWGGTDIVKCALCSGSGKR